MPLIETLIERICHLEMRMVFGNTRCVRFQDDAELAKIPTANGDNGIKLLSSNKDHNNREARKAKKFLKARVLSRVFSEDYERVRRRILDPRGQTIHRWNKIFLLACLVSLFVDPLFFYLPLVQHQVCIGIGTTLEVILTIIRSIADLFYMIQIIMRYRTAYVAPSSRVFGRGELVIDPAKIAARYFFKGFWLDFVAALPLPQVLIWIVIPNLGGSTMANTKNVLRFIIIFQYIPRLFLIFPLSSQIVKATGVVTETAWAGAAYNLMLYMLASHFFGACWYLLSIERQEACWRRVCDMKNSSCKYSFFDCNMVKNPLRDSWFKGSNVTKLCSPEAHFYPFGIYGDAVTSRVTTSPFFKKYFYCLWWGLRNLSSLGQNLLTSTFVGEIMFAILVATLGLVLFALLIGNMQTYLQSTTVRLEEWRVKRTDTEQWMHHRQLPQELRQSVRKYDQYKWLATRGVDEEALLKDLPLDLRRDIKRHLCIELVRRVPLFEQMDERMLDAICERLKPSLCTESTYLVREGDPVNEMLFIIRGNLDSYTTNGGRTGFFNSCRIGPGDFCGEELLTWALDPKPSVIILPCSTRTVKAISEVEAFALMAEDLKFVASQFRRLHSKQLRHKFRIHSHQWRTWAACFIQAAWRRFKKRKEAAELRAREENEAETHATRSNRKGMDVNSGADSEVVSSLQKPAEPDFSVDE
ncbi:protein CNGC15b-like [Arachis ipaensis]|uniref:protein CNGC15b-like n=1 Tax=Arachis ipaensis TaxID=130454 RepID=UPI0007AF2BAE|nr:protein CNGC15b-like [Arachis ipaensis]